MGEKLYLTKKGLERMRKEYERMLDQRKQQTKNSLGKSRTPGDAAAEYIAYQEELGLLDVRIAQYERILKNAELITPPPKKEQDRVHLGATITLEEEAPERRINEYTLLQGLEANPGAGIISADSPVGKALLGKRIGDTIVVSSPIHVVYRIKKITYRSNLI